MIFVTFINIYCVYILIKARNRFKHRRVDDIVDLCVILYGEKSRVYMQIVLFSSNMMYLVFYEIFFGTQIDQLVCKTYRIYSCGNKEFYIIMINICLLPIIFQKSFRNIAYFSGFVLIFSSMAFIIIIWKCSEILSLSIKLRKILY